MTNYIIPSIIIAIILYSIITNKNTYEHFVFGAKSSFDLIISTFPYLVAIFIMLEIYSASGLSNIIETILSPIFNIFKIPKELIPLILIKPFSGSGSIATLENIYKTYGVDSYLSKAASAIIGSSEAIFFVSGVYFSKTKVKHMGLAIFIALISNFIGAIVAIHISKII